MQEYHTCSYSQENIWYSIQNVNQNVDYYTNSCFDDCELEAQKQPKTRPCEDVNAFDSRGETCQAYESNPETCGFFDTKGEKCELYSSGDCSGDFEAKDCCACKTEEELNQPSPFCCHFE